MKQSVKCETVLVSFEGVGGAGKSLQVEMLQRDRSWQESNGIELRVLKGLDRRSMAESLGYFKDYEKEKLWVTELPKVHPGTDMLAFIAMMFEKYMVTSENMSCNGKTKMIVFDRYIDTAFTHAAARIMLSHMPGTEEKVIDLYKAFSGLKPLVKWPDITIVIETPLDIAEARAQKREGKSYEGKDRKGFEIITNLYRMIASYEPNRIYFIDGTKSPEAIHSEVIAAINKKILMLKEF